MKNGDEKIEQIKKILSGGSNLLSLVFQDLWNEFKEIIQVFRRNFFGRSGTRKMATIIFLLLILVPALFSYTQLISTGYNKIHNWIYFDNNITVLKNEYEESVRSFLKTYNEKYGVDCEWIKKVNVDINMAALGTERKPGMFCNLNYKMQIYPITVESPSTKGTQTALVSGKAIVAIFEGANLKNAWYQRYNLWRDMSWSINEWKFNPFSQEDKEKLK